MRVLQAILLGTQLSAVLALPTSPSVDERALSADALSALEAALSSIGLNVGTGAAKTEGAVKAGEGKAVGGAKKNETAKVGGAAGEEGAAENELNVAGTFNKVVALGGNNVKTDVLFTKATTGALEVEFQNAVGNNLLVTENKTPAAPPLGFKALDPASYKIALSAGSNQITLQKVDYVLDITNADVIAAGDLTQARIGKLCEEAKAFVISEALGELEFEAEENELSLTTDNMVGEWGIFIPEGAAAAANVEALRQAKAGEAKAVEGGAAKAGEAKVVEGAAAKNETAIVKGEGAEAEKAAREVEEAAKVAEEAQKAAEKAAKVEDRRRSLYRA
ncbi:hypothetical protein B0J14DRAFT_261015 [Halenospora varia]|nr:hypothetical protein B0J14DRAFT_261015 [Halenospora varia]